MSDSGSSRDINEQARKRNEALLLRFRDALIDLEPRFLIQMAHLTTPATVWKYVEGAATRSRASLVMLDLEDSIPRGDERLLETGRNNVIRAFRELDWGSRLRFFRPRGLELDPGFEDIAVVVDAAGAHMDGLIYPKVESADEVRSIDATLTDLEKKNGLSARSIHIEVLIESVAAEEAVFEIARASRRLVGLIFGSYDYWASMGMPASSYRQDHPLVNQARGRIVKAASLVGVPAIAEMTTNYPTSDKSEEEKRAALEEFRRDAEMARDFGFVGKWTGIPAQTELAVEMFTLKDAEIERAVREAEAFLAAEVEGRGATMIGGRMADRATDRINRQTLKTAFALGRLDRGLAARLGIG